MAISQARNLQPQSRLVSLPNELKNIIFSYCFVSERPIVDPVLVSHPVSAESEPELGTGVLQTCRRVYCETDRRPLYSRNRFHFTTLDKLTSFLDGLPYEHRVLIRDIEIDARRVHADHPGIGHEWLQYLAYGGGTWSKTLGSLRTKVDGLQCLRLNVEHWPDIPMFRAELWNLLRSMLLQMNGLGRVVVIGAKRPVRWYKHEPWSPVHFVGGENVESNDLVQHIGRTVEGQDLDKLIRWSREDGGLSLEVISGCYRVEEVDKPWVEISCGTGITEPWPQYGICTWSVYQKLAVGASERP